MNAIKSTTRNPKECNLNATCGEVAFSEVDSPMGDSPARKARPKGFARSQVGYWKKALRVSPTGNFMVQVSYGGRRGRFTFERNAEAAAEKARQIFLCIQKDGWEAAIVRFSPRGAASSRRKTEEARVSALGGRLESPSIGDFLGIAREFSTVRPITFQGYAKALRLIVSEVFSVPHLETVPVTGKRKSRRKGPEELVRIKDLRRSPGGLARWQAAVDAVKLADLTPDKVAAWGKAYVERAVEKAGGDLRAKERAQVSFNSVIRNAKALFGEKKQKYLPKLEKRIVLSRPLPFDGVAMEEEHSMSYHSRIDPGELLNAAVTGLEPANPEAFKALVLCLVLGLRRSEADTLLWRQLDFENREVSIEPTEFYALKSKKSARVLALDDRTLAILRGWNARANRSAFVLESPSAPRPLARSRFWRCNATFEALGKWLKGQGVTAQKPIHDLRKETGTLLLKQGQPIELVSRYLGHSAIAITLKHYADFKERAKVDLASLMPAEIVDFPGAADAERESPAKPAIG